MQMDGDESSNIEDRRGEGGGFRRRRLRRRRLRRRRHPGGVPMGGGLFKGGFGLIAIVVIGLILGVNPLSLLGGGGGGSSYVARKPDPTPAAPPIANADPETQFVARVLKSTEDVWAGIFQRDGPADTASRGWCSTATPRRPPAAWASRRWGRSIARPTSGSISTSPSSTSWRGASARPASSRRPT